MLQQSQTNFLTLDHARPRSGQAGEHDPSNLVTACYECNVDRGARSLRAWCASRGWSYEAVRARSFEARRADVNAFSEAARVLLGQVDGVPRADLVDVMTWRARRQWAGWQERLDWAKEVETCKTCHRRIGDPGDLLEVDSAPIPF
jgi:hypothetical protein